MIAGFGAALSLRACIFHDYPVGKRQLAVGKKIINYNQLLLNDAKQMTNLQLAVGNPRNSSKSA